jgi:Tol biopolymer transport system component
MRAGSLSLIRVLLALTVTVQCGAGSAERGSSTPTVSWSIDGARILFTGRRGSARELYIPDRATNHTTRLAYASGDDSGANSGRVSPDGQRVAFQVQEGKNYDIHVMSISGGQSVNVTRHPDYDVLPAWSPDGQRLAFMSTRNFELGGVGPVPGHVYVAAADGTELRQVTSEPLTSSFGPSDWSGDGKTLLIARVIGERPDLFLLDLESGREQRLTDTPQGEYSAVFSRDGKRVAFHSETASESQIVLMNLDGTGRRVLTAGPGFRCYPRWSPDDRWILFTASDSGDQYDLRAVHLETGEVIDLLATPEDEREGEWLPVGDAPASR